VRVTGCEVAGKRAPPTVAWRVRPSWFRHWRCGARAGRREVGVGAGGDAEHNDDGEGRQQPLSGDSRHFDSLGGWTGERGELREHSSIGNGSVSLALADRLARPVEQLPAASPHSRHRPGHLQARLTSLGPRGLRVAPDFLQPRRHDGEGRVAVGGDRLERDDMDAATRDEAAAAVAPADVAGVGATGDFQQPGLRAPAVLLRRPTSSVTSRTTSRPASEPPLTTLRS